MKMKMFFLLAVSAIVFSVAAEASVMSSVRRTFMRASAGVVQKVAKPVQAAAVVGCLGMSCAVGVGDAADWHQMKRLALRGSLADGSLLGGAELTYLARDTDWYTGPGPLDTGSDETMSFGYLDFAVEGNGDGELRVPRLRFAFHYDYELPDGMSYADGHKITKVTTSALGYDIRDFRDYELDEGEGFLAYYIHLFGLSTPYFGGSFGISGWDTSEGVFGDFKHPELMEWINGGSAANLWAGLHYDAFMALRLRSVYADLGGGDVLPVDAGIRIERFSTLTGGIRRGLFMELGDLTATWDSVLADARWQLHSGHEREGGVFLVGEFEVYSQHIEATLHGRTFDQKGTGKRFAVKLEGVFD